MVRKLFPIVLFAVCLGLALFIAIPTIRDLFPGYFYRNAVVRDEVRERSWELHKAVTAYRQEHGATPQSLSDLVDGGLVDPSDDFSGFEVTPTHAMVWAYQKQPCPRIERGEGMPPRFRDRYRVSIPAAHAVVFADGRGPAFLQPVDLQNILEGK